ncbi:MAG: hypothetical protein M3332_11430 [Actinomycetota bacterium]|jgi:hypothetical protein|nr:hypothetical protein [Actinomycetota bacterium]
MSNAPNAGRPIPVSQRAVDDSGSAATGHKDHYGGVKVGSAFFGWLTATGTAVLLTALVSAIAGAVGLAVTTGADQVADEVAQNPQTAGLVGGVVLMVILFVAYYCGGYVAGRMARFNGIKQGIAVWVWGLVMALVVALLGAIAGSQFDPLTNINGLSQLPITAEMLTTGGIIAALAAAAVSLLGAILGGLGGMRFHRNVDRASLDS